MRIISGLLYIGLSILCGWGIHTAFVWYDVTEIVAAHTYQTQQITLEQMPRNITALIKDIVSTHDMPPCTRDMDTLAADIGDEYIALGDAFYTLPQNIQRFIMAHEMVHYTQQHHIHDMLCRTIYLPVIMLACFTILMVIFSCRIHRLHTGIRTACNHIATRTFGLHARGVQALVRTVLHMLLYIAITGISYVGCDAIHTYIIPGLEQYIEYRADVYAVYDTHDADSPCTLFDSDDQTIIGPHPHDVDRRSYIRYCQAHNYIIPTWGEMIHLLTPQQLSGAILYNMTYDMPYYADIYNHLVSISQWVHPEENVV